MPESSSKSITLQLLQLLRSETDQDYRLFLEELVQRMEDKFGLTHSRKTMRRDLDAFQQAGLPVFYNRGWYYQHALNSSELEYVANCVAGGVGLTREDRMRIVNKIRRIGSTHDVLFDIPISNYPGNNEMLNNLSLLRQAVSAGEQVEVLYGSYGEDKALHTRLTRAGKPRHYTLSPYSLIPFNGRIYLAALANRHETIGHFRVDRIMAVKLLHRPNRALKKGDEDCCSAGYVLRHPYMYTGELHTYRIVLHKDSINNVLDFFGMDAVIERISDRRLEAVVRCDMRSMEFWMRRFDDRIGQVTLVPSDGDKNETEKGKP